jgi:anti-sigma factor RsiW
MNRCEQNRHVQAYLDGELSAAEAARFESHAASCSECAPELLLYRRLFASLTPRPIRDPGPALTERILDRVLPSRLRRRWISAIGWSYTAATATCTFMFASWISRPETHVWLGQQLGAALERVVRIGWWGLDAFVFAWMHAVLAGEFMLTIGARLVPVARALVRPLSDPAIGASVWSAVLGCALLLWWLRSRGEPAREEVPHVDVVGF